MKKLVFVLAMTLIGLVVFGQARTSDPSISEFVLFAELTKLQDGPSLKVNGMETLIK
jgi:hypothetical protein